jgi:hypothetical protein
MLECKNALGESVDTKEIVCLVGSAAGSFAFAAETIAQMSALFAAIKDMLPAHNPAHKLASLGEDLCEDRAEGFFSCRDEYNAHTERFVTGGAHG